MNIKSLYEAKKNSNHQVVEAPDVCQLGNLGIRTGTKVMVQSRYAFGGPVLLRVDDTYTVAVGKDVAKDIQVVDVCEGEF